MSSLLEQLRAARRERKIAQKALGERLGLPQSHVSAIEAGKVDRRLSSILEFARVLDLEPMLIPRDRVLAVRALLVRRALRCVESGNWLLADDIEAIWYQAPYASLAKRGGGSIRAGICCRGVDGSARGLPRAGDIAAMDQSSRRYHGGWKQT